MHQTRAVRKGVPRRRYAKIGPGRMPGAIGVAFSRVGGYAALAARAVSSSP